MEAPTSTLRFDPEQNAIIDRADGSIIPVDLLGTSLDALPDHIKAQIQCKKDEDYARSLSGQSMLSAKTLKTSSLYAPLELGARGSDHETLGGKTLEEEYMDIYSASPGDPGAIEERAADADWTLARALQGLEFEIIQDTMHDPLSEDFNEKEYRASSCKRQLMTASTLICLVQVFVPLIYLMVALIICFRLGYW